MSSTLRTFEYSDMANCLGISRIVREFNSVPNENKSKSMQCAASDLYFDISVSQKVELVKHIEPTEYDFYISTDQRHMDIFSSIFKRTLGFPLIKTEIAISGRQGGRIIYIDSIQMLTGIMEILGKDIGLLFNSHLKVVFKHFQNHNKTT